MLVIRLRRVGKKRKPTYRIVVAEHTLALDGKFTSDLGHYNPHTKDVVINKEELKSWLDKGAQPSNTVSKILKKEKVTHKSVNVILNTPRKPRKKDESEKPAKVETPKTENKTEEVASEEVDAKEETPTEEVTANEEEVELKEEALAEETPENTDSKEEPTEKPAETPSE